MMMSLRQHQLPLSSKKVSSVFSFLIILFILTSNILNLASEGIVDVDDPGSSPPLQEVEMIPEVASSSSRFVPSPDSTKLRCLFKSLEEVGE
jgi:hypothetical protein